MVRGKGCREKDNETIVFPTSKKKIKQRFCKREGLLHRTRHRKEGVGTWIIEKMLGKTMRQKRVCDKTRHNEEKKNQRVGKRLSVSFRRTEQSFGKD